MLDTRITKKLNFQGSSNFLKTAMTQSHNEAFVFGLIIFILWIYLVLRAILIQPMHDEIATFFFFVQSGRFIPYFSEWSTNNHLLNSALTHISFNLFGLSPIALRIPNLIVFPLYGFFIWKTGSYIKYLPLRWGFFIATLFVHNYFEFFGLSRGYGMAFTSLVGSIWFTMLAFNTPKSKNIFFALLLGVLTVSAILININSLIVIFVLLIALIIYRGEGQRTKIITIILFLGLLPILLAVRFLLDLNKAGSLNYGGNIGFWTTSVKDLTNMLFGSGASFVNIYIIILLIFLAAAIIHLFYKKWSEGFTFDFLFKPQWVFFYLLIGNLLGFFIEHHLFGVLYPESRTMMQFVILFSGSLFVILDNIENSKKAFLIIPVLPVFLLPIHFLGVSNFNKISVENETIPKRFLSFIEKRVEESNLLPTIQGYKGRELRWAYLNYRERTFMPMVSCTTYPDTIADYQIIQPENYPYLNNGYKLIDRDHVSGISILEREKKLKRELLIEREPEFSDEFTSDEFILISKGDSELANNSLFFAEYEVNLQSKHKYPTVWIVVEIKDFDGNRLVYERVPLNWYNYNWKSGLDDFKTGILAITNDSFASEYITYLWNANCAPLKINKVKFSLHYLKT